MKLKFTSQPCQEAVKWLAEQPDAQTAWDNCENGGWMWWALRHLPGALPPKNIVVLFANWCARRAKKHTARAAESADCADCAEAAADYAYAADYAAYAAYAADYAAYAARAACATYAAAAAERKAQADWIRKHVKCPL